MSNAALRKAISAWLAISGSTARIVPSATPSAMVPAKRRAMRFERSTIAWRATFGRPLSAVVRSSGACSENWTSRRVAIAAVSRSHCAPPRSSASRCAAAIVSKLRW